MTICAAVIREQDVTFAVVLVQLIEIQTERDVVRTRGRVAHLFPDMPIVFACETSPGVTRFHGQPDLVRFLAGITESRIPWKQHFVPQVSSQRAPLASAAAAF